MSQRSTKGTNALSAHVVRFVLSCALVAVACVVVEAASLYGKVIEVNSGDVITIFNLNRPVRIKLLGVDAPELDQAFGDVAKKHLSDLVFDKPVLVHYEGIAADKSLIGRVLVNDADIGAQMIRDGAAWFDARNSDRLQATDREVYQQSELAARNERRGLWQQPNPTAPWEFVKAEAAHKNPVAASLNSSVPGSRTRDVSKESELTNLTLMATKANVAPPRQMTRSEIEEAWGSLTGTNKNLRELHPAGQNFSVLVPDGGRQITQPLAFGDEPIDVNMYMSRDGASLYAVFWLTGPTYGETDTAAIEGMVLSFIKASHKEYQEGDKGSFFCGKKREKDISTSGYTGREYDMSSCSLPTRARAFTKVVDDRRQMFVGIVFYGDEDENVGKFIRSFSVGSQKTGKR